MIRRDLLTHAAAAMAVASLPTPATAAPADLLPSFAMAYSNEARRTALGAATVAEALRCLASRLEALGYDHDLSSSITIQLDREDWPERMVSFVRVRVVART